MHDVHVVMLTAKGQEYDKQTLVNSLLQIVG